METSGGVWAPTKTTRLPIAFRREGGKTVRDKWWQNLGRDGVRDPHQEPRHGEQARFEAFKEGDGKQKTPQSQTLWPISLLRRDGCHQRRRPKNEFDARDASCAARGVL